MTDTELAALKTLLTVNEGRKSWVYDDATGQRIVKGSHVLGHPTFGVGFNLDAIPICDAAIEAQLDYVLTPLIAQVLAALPWAETLPPGPLRVLIDVAYNAGVAGLLEFKKMLAFAEARQFELAAVEIRNSSLAVNRANRLAAIMRA